MRPPAPIVVVGAGIAGLSVALSAAPHEVVLIDRGGINSTALAQGGLAAVLAEDDSVDSHVNDTLAAGAFHNDPALTAGVLAAAPAAVQWLQSMGVEFDTDGHALHLGREGGHRANRIVHSGGDRTGERVLSMLASRARESGHIQWRHATAVDALLLEGQRVAGVRTRGADGATEVVEASAVVLATGGIGALFERTTNPGGNTGAGLALAISTGAQVRDLEFVQFHPTAMDTKGDRLPLITEALRGAGARLLDHRGHALMAGRHPLGDLAPRDVVARRVWEAGREGPVWLDATALPRGWEHAFPTVATICHTHAVDPRVQPIPVTAAAHFHMGGIATDAIGRTSLHDLYAVGEVACNGLHGANRLASNSLLEGAVCGQRLGAHLRDTKRRRAGNVFRLVEPGRSLEPSLLAALRRQLWEAAGPVRTAHSLTRAIASVCAMTHAGWEARIAHGVLDAALRRSGSLGSHWRDDATESRVA